MRDRFPLRVVVAGLGRRGRKWVAFVRARTDFRLAAAADVDPAARREAAEALSLPSGACLSSLEAAIERTEPDAVIVATPIDQHVGPCEAAVRAGLGVLVEKPFTVSLADARRLVDLAETHGAPLVVGQNHRYTHLAQRLRGVLRRGGLGPIGLLACEHTRPIDGLSAVLERVPRAVLWETAVHHVDLLRYVTGRRITDVLAQEVSSPWDHGGEARALQVVLGLDGGARGYYSASYGSSREQFVLRVVGERASLHVWQRWMVTVAPGRIPQIRRAGPWRRPENALLTQLRDAIVAGTEPECSGRDNLHTVEALDACERSIREGRRIVLAEPVVA